MSGLKSGHYFVRLSNKTSKEKNMKKIILASLIASAAIFTACGDDDSSTSSSSGSVKSCDINAAVPLMGSIHACVESEDMQDAEKQCKEELAALLPGEPDVAFGTGCPKGSKLECKYEKDGAHLTVLIYDETLSKLSCDELKAFILQ